MQTPEYHRVQGARVRYRKGRAVSPTSPVGLGDQVCLRPYGDAMAELEELQAELLALKEKQAAAEKQIAELEEANKNISSDLSDARAINKKLILNSPSPAAAPDSPEQEEEDDREPQEILDEEVIKATDEHVEKAIDVICGRKRPENGQRTSAARPHQR